MKLKISKGLVFAVPLSDGAFGLGQLIERQSPIYYMVAYDVHVRSLELDQRVLGSMKPILMGNFFDVLIHIRRWKPIGNFPIPTVDFPCFKVKTDDKFYVESWDRKRRREATPDDLEILEYRTDYGPIILENALKAYFGLGPWEKLFDPLKAESVANVSKLC